jgi:hypothetical protein
MIFRVYEHYDDEQPLYKSYSDEIDICFICYEIRTPLELKPTSLQKQLYYKKCRCDGLIHQACLEMWICKQHKCPICRAVLIQPNYSKNTFIVIVFYLNQFGIFARTLLIRLIKIILYSFLIYIYIEFYIYLSTSKHIIRNMVETKEHSFYNSSKRFYNSPQEL